MADPETTFNFDYPGRKASEAAAQETVLRERIDLGEHVHLLGRPATSCWNGNDRCMVWLAQGGHDAEPFRQPADSATDGNEALPEPS